MDVVFLSPESTDFRRSFEGAAVFRRADVLGLSQAVSGSDLFPVEGTPTFPCATSSLCAAEAALTRALVAAAMDLAASRICSSKFRLSSASC